MYSLQPEPRKYSPILPSPRTTHYSKRKKKEGTKLKTIIIRRYCSPRINARRTAETFNLGIHNHLHFLGRQTGEKFKTPSMIQGETAGVDVQLTKWLEEGDSGDYEGMTLYGIQEARMKEFGDATWDIWRKRCPGGEYVVHGCYACPHLLRQDCPNGWGCYDMRIDIFGANARPL